MAFSSPPREAVESERSDSAAQETSARTPDEVDPNSLRGAEPLKGQRHTLSSSVTIEDGDDDVHEWMPPAKASRMLAVSKGTLVNWAQAGRLKVRIDERGWREYKVTRAAVREMIAYRKSRDANMLLVDVVRMAEEDGKSATQIVLDLACPPALVQKTLAAHRQVVLELRQYDIERRAYELSVGAPKVPTTWAWVAECFTNNLSHRQAHEDFKQWMETANGGEAGAEISPLVRRVLASESAWIAASYAWNNHDKYEVERFRQEQEALRGIDSKKKIIDLEKKKIQLEEGSQRLVHREHRESDRHQRVNASSARKNGLASDGGSKVPIAPMPQRPSHEDE